MDDLTTPEFIAMLRGLASRWIALADGGPGFDHMREAAAHIDKAADDFEAAGGVPLTRIAFNPVVLPYTEPPN